MVSYDELLEEMFRRYEKYEKIISISKPLTLEDEILELLERRPIKRRRGSYIYGKYRQVFLSAQSFFYLTECVRKMGNKDILTVGDLALAEVAITTVRLYESSFFNILGIFKDRAAVDDVISEEEKEEAEQYFYDIMGFALSNIGFADRIYYEYRDLLNVPAYINDDEENE